MNDTKKLIKQLQSEENQGYIFHLGESLLGANDYDFKFIIKNDLRTENIDFSKIDYDDVWKYLNELI